MPPCLSSEPVVCLGARGLGKEKRVLKRFVANTLRGLLLKKSSKHYFQKSSVIAQDQWNTWIHGNEHMFYQAGSSTIAGYKSNLTFHFPLQLTIALEPTCIVSKLKWFFWSCFIFNFFLIRIFVPILVPTRPDESMATLTRGISVFVLPGLQEKIARKVKSRENNISAKSKQRVFSVAQSWYTNFSLLKSRNVDEACNSQ